MTPGGAATALLALAVTLGALPDPLLRWLSEVALILCATAAILGVGWVALCEITRRRHQHRLDERRCLAEMRRVLGQGRDER